jgi:multidrug resistance efflux pump
VAGEALCILEDEELRLKIEELEGELAMRGKELQKALATHDATTAEIVSAQMDRARAQLALLERQLARTSVASPIQGVVVKGDLSQSIGAPVERGQVLFEVAPLDDYRIALKVDERDISDVQVGQAGMLLLPALPGRQWPFTVRNVTPVSSAEGDRNTFRVEGRFAGAGDPRLRPGMEGVAKIDIEQRSLASILGRRVLEWLRVTQWSWMP